MSAQEIIAELPKLSRPELKRVEVRLHELLSEKGKSPSSWGEALQQVAGAIKDLPADFAQQHDHYLHGSPKG